MTKKAYAPHTHTGRTGPLDPTMERAHLLARWEEEEFTATVPLAMAVPEDDWLFAEVPASPPSGVPLDGQG